MRSNGSSGKMDSVSDKGAWSSLRNESHLIASYENSLKLMRHEGCCFLFASLFAFFLHSLQYSMALHVWKHGILMRPPPHTVTHNLLKLTVWPPGTCWRCISLGSRGVNGGCLWHCTPVCVPSSAPVQQLAPTLSFCETANEKEWKVITGWGLITCTVSHSWQPH